MVHGFDKSNYLMQIIIRDNGDNNQEIKDFMSEKRTD